MNKKNPKYKQKQDEVILYYDLAQDIGCRPYVFFFPYEQNPFKQNAVDVKMKSIWTQHQVKLKKEAKQKSTWGKGSGNSAVQTFNIN